MVSHTEDAEAIVRELQRCDPKKVAKALHHLDGGGTLVSLLERGQAILRELQRGDPEKVANILLAEIEAHLPPSDGDVLVEFLMHERERRLAAEQDAAFQQLLGSKRPKLVRAVEIFSRIRGQHPELLRETSQWQRRIKALEDRIPFSLGPGDTRGREDVKRTTADLRHALAGRMALRWLGWGGWDVVGNEETGALEPKRHRGRPGKKSQSVHLPRWLYEEDPACLDRDPPDQVPTGPGGLWLVASNPEQLTLKPRLGETLRLEVVRAIWQALELPEEFGPEVRKEVVPYVPSIFPELLDTRNGSPLRNELKNVVY